MPKIQKVSSHLLTAFNGLLIMVPLISIFQWFFMETKTTDVGAAINFFGLLEREVATPEGLVNLSTVGWTLPLKFLGLSADMFGLLPFLLGLFCLKSLFRNYQKGEIFTVINAMHYRRLGWLFFFDALVVKSLSKTLLVLAVTLTNPPGHRYLTLEFGTPNLKALFCGVLVLFISWVMAEANKLYDDQKFTI